jgi:hypothetical protein
MKVTTGVLIAMAASLLAIAAAAQVPERRQLADIAVTAADNEATTLRANEPAQPWALVVLDPALPSAAALLRSLLAKDTVWTSRLTILLTGQSPMLDRAVASDPRMANVRVVTAATPNALASLKVPGVPAVLGIQSGGTIIWMRAGVPQQPARLHDQLAAWLSIEREEIPQE